MKRSREKTTGFFLSLPTEESRNHFSGAEGEEGKAAEKCFPFWVLAWISCLLCLCMRVCFQLIQVFIFLHFFYLKKVLFHYSVLESQIYIACFLLGFSLFCYLSEMGRTFMCFLQLYDSVSVKLVFLVEVSAFMRNCWVWLGFDLQDVILFMEIGNIRWIS